MTFDDILMAYRKAKKITNWVDTAAALGYSDESGLRSLRSGKRKRGLDDDTVAKLMDGTGLEAFEIVAAYEAEYGKKEIVRKSWKRFLKEHGNAAAIILTFTLPLFSNTYQYPVPDRILEIHQMYIM